MMMMMMMMMMMTMMDDCIKRGGTFHWPNKTLPICCGFDLVCLLAALN